MTRESDIIFQYQCVMYHLTSYIYQFYFHIYVAMCLFDVVVALDV
jgi:hypothetical protein